MPKLNFTPRIKNPISFFIKVAVVLTFAVLLVTMLPAAMPEDESESTKPTVTMPFDDEMPEVEGVVRPDLFPHLVIVYSDGDTWGKEEADHLVWHLEPQFHAHFVVISDTEYLALGEDELSLYNREPSLTLNVGITKLLDESYLEILGRLGEKGLEIRRDGNRIDIISASLSRVHEGIESFVTALTFDSSFKISEDFFILDAKGGESSTFTPDIVTDGEANVLVLSYVDSNPYTLRAIEGIVAHAKPDIVVFNGGVDGGAKTRAELGEMWQAIADILKKADTPWCFTPGNLSGSLPRVTVCEVISSFPGCIRKLSGERDAAFGLTVANSNGVVTSSIYVGDTFGNNALLCELIENDTELYARASSYKRSVTAILPALPKQISDACEDVSDAYVSKSLYDLYDSLTAAGADSFICTSDATECAVLEFEGGKVGFCGSVGFDSQGLGGRFDYNHSLRGAMMLTLTPHRAEYSLTEISYIYAADLGLCER